MGLDNTFYIDSGGSFTQVTMPSSFFANGVSVAGINSSGQIAGTYFRDVGQHRYGFIYSNGTFTQIPDDLPNDINGPIITGINDSGQVLGYYFDFIGVSTSVTTGFVATFSNGTWNYSTMVGAANAPPYDPSVPSVPGISYAFTNRPNHRLILRQSWPVLQLHRNTGHGARTDGRADDHGHAP